MGNCKYLNTGSMNMGAKEKKSNKLTSVNANFIG